MELKRNIYKEIIEDIHRKDIGIIMGPRQVGKTTILKKIAGHCKNKNITHRYFNLEMPVDAYYFSKDSDEILKDFCKKKQISRCLE
ncbi:MAG: AAA family ATPase [Candidatus Omnitrophica bacterium]|nr:AAA family ATPase [Candidatus Omnitrophota bacterium]